VCAHTSPRRIRPPRVAPSSCSKLALSFCSVPGGTLFTNLAPIPFDWQVRAAFATNEIPSLRTRWSAFGLGVLRIMKPLFPALSEKLEALEKELVGDWYKEVTSKIEELSRQREEISVEESIRKVSRQRERIRGVTLIIAIGSVLIAVYGMAEVFYIYPFYILRRAVTVLAGLLGVIGSLTLYHKSMVYMEEEAMRKVIKDIELQLQKYVTLIATDPQLREYARTPEKGTVG
jgi:hypothetical protein